MIDCYRCLLRAILSFSLTECVQALVGSTILIPSSVLCCSLPLPRITSELGNILHMTDNGLLQTSGQALGKSSWTVFQRLVWILPGSLKTVQLSISSILSLDWDPSEIRPSTHALLGEFGCTTPTLHLNPRYSQSGLRENDRLHELERNWNRILEGIEDDGKLFDRASRVGKRWYKFER